LVFGFAQSFRSIFLSCTLQSFSPWPQVEWSSLPRQPNQTNSRTRCRTVAAALGDSESNTKTFSRNLDDCKSRWRRMKLRALPLRAPTSSVGRFVRYGEPVSTSSSEPHRHDGTAFLATEPFLSKIVCPPLDVEEIGSVPPNSPCVTTQGPLPDLRGMARRRTARGHQHAVIGGPASPSGQRKCPTRLRNTQSCGSSDR
jgi:hypothetical protein